MSVGAQDDECEVYEVFLDQCHLSTVRCHNSVGADNVTEDPARVQEILESLPMRCDHSCCHGGNGLIEPRRPIGAQTVLTDEDGMRKR